MRNWQIYPIRDLSGGMQMAVSPFLVSSDELYLVKNWDLEEIGSLEKSSGYEQRGNTISGATNIAGLAPFYYGDNQKEVVAVDTGSAIDMYTYTPSDNTWTAQSLSLTTGTRFEFATFLDGLFAVNRIDSSYFFDGTTWSTSTNLTGAPKARYVIPFLDRLYMANLDISGTEHPSRVALSSLPDASYNITWDTSDTGLYFDVSPKDGDVIKGLGKNFNRLLIFKEESLWRYDTNTLYQFPGAPGTNNSRTIVNVLDWTIYFYKDGIYGVRGNEVVKLSRAIRPIIDGVQSTNLDKLCAYGDGDYYKIYLGDVENSKEGISIDNCVAILDVANQRWAIGSLGHAPTVFARYRDDRSEVTYNDTSYDYDYADKTYDGLVSAEDFIHFGDDTGKIYQISDTAKDFAGTRIRSYFETHNYYIAGVESRAQIHALKAYVDRGRRLKLYYSIDDGPWKPILKYKIFNKELYFEFPQGLEGNRVKLKGTDNSVGLGNKVYGFDIFYTRLNRII